MALFSAFFGGSASKYSPIDYPVTELEMHRLFNSWRNINVQENQENLVEGAILAARHPNGKISLRTIYETLKRLQSQRRLSKNDRKILMTVFDNYFKEHFLPIK